MRRAASAGTRYTKAFADAGPGRTEITVRWAPYDATEAEHEVFEDGKDSMTAGRTGTFDRLDAFLGRA